MYSLASGGTFQCAIRPNQRRLAEPLIILICLSVWLRGFVGVRIYPGTTRIPGFAATYCLRILPSSGIETRDSAAIH